MGLFFEPGFQALGARRAGWIVDGANCIYVNSHFVITTTFLIWLYLAPQRRLLLRAQHVHDRDGHRAGRLRRSSRPRRRASCPSGASPTPSPSSSGPQALEQRRGALQPVRRRAEHARRLRADGRHPGGAARDPRAAERRLGRLPGARHLRGRGHRQPLLARRRRSARWSPASRRVAGRRQPRARSRARPRGPAWALRGPAALARPPPSRRADAAHARRASASPTMRDARAQPPDRVAADAQRDLADRASR